jgi:hypothetical protein
MKPMTVTAYAGAMSLCLAVASATSTSEPNIGTCDPGIEGNNCQGCPAGTETTHQSESGKQFGIDSMPLSFFLPNLSNGALQ